MNEITISDRNEIMEAVLLKGDLGKLTAAERNSYYMQTCHSLGLNPLTQPFAYITLNGKLTMYAKRDAADQLRKINGVNIEILEKRVEAGLFMVTVRATDKSGRQDEDMGVVTMPSAGAGEIKANAMLKAITKAKRRVTLSICGLGFLDETEVEDIPVTAKTPARRQTQVVQSPVKSVDFVEPSSPQEPSSQGSSPAEEQSAADPDAPHPAAADTLTPAQQEADDLLADAATRGWGALREMWDVFPYSIRVALRDRLNDVHKPAAHEVGP